MKRYICFFSIILFIFIPCVNTYGVTIHSLAVDKSYDGEVYSSGYCDSLWVGAADLTGWEESASGMGSKIPIGYYTIFCIKIAPGDADIMYCGTSEGYVYRSANRGATWLDTGLKVRHGIWAIDVDPANANHLFASGIGGL